MAKSPNEVLRDHVRFTGDGLPNEPVGAPLPKGDPRSGLHEPDKKDVREALNAAAQIVQHIDLELLDAQVAQVAEDRAAAVAAADQAALAASAAGTAAAYYDTIALGRAAAANGATFGVFAGGPDGLTRPTLFRRDSASTQTMVNDQPTGTEVDNVSGRVGAVEGDLGGASFAGIDDPVIGFALTNEAGNTSVIELGHEGDYTPRAYQMIAAGVEPLLPSPSLDGIRAEDLPEGSGVGFSIGNEAGNTTDLEVDPQGSFTRRVLDKILAYVVANMPAPPVVDLWSGPPPAFARIGDSLSAAGGWGAHLTLLSGVPNVGYGVGGETARGITARMSAIPMVATPVGGEIPATTTPVVVSLAYSQGGAVRPLVQGGPASINPCEIMGVQGTLSRIPEALPDPERWEFTRAVAGDAVRVAFPVPITTNAYTTNRHNLPIVGIGQNSGFADLDDLMRMNWAIINQTDQGRAQRFLVWSGTGGTAASRAEMEARYLQEFGPRYVNVRARLSSYWALEFAGITPTPEDDAAIAEGRVPPSLTSDGLHHNAAGQIVIGTLFYWAGRALKYWS